MDLRNPKAWWAKGDVQKIGSSSVNGSQSVGFLIGCYCMLLTMSERRPVSRICRDLEDVELIRDELWTIDRCGQGVAVDGGTMVVMVCGPWVKQPETFWSLQTCSKASV